MAPGWWPYAGKHFCCAHNFTRKYERNHNQTPYESRHKGVPFVGTLAPFGCLIDFKPSPVRGKVVSKFSARAVPGLFLGWHMSPGGKFKGDYLAISIEDLKLKTFSRNPILYIQRIKEVFFDKEVDPIFPLKELYDKSRRSIQVDIPMEGSLDRVDEHDKTVQESKPVPASSSRDVVADEHGVLRDSKGNKVCLDDEGNVILDDEGKPVVVPKRRIIEQIQDDIVPIKEKIIPSERIGEPPAEQIVPKTDPNFLEWYQDDMGRNARKQKTPRPPYIIPEVWQMLSPKDRSIEVAKFKRNCLEHGIPLPDHKAYRDDPADFEAALAHVSTNIEILLNSMDTDAPRMPIRPMSMFANHRPKVPEFAFPFSALVARPVGKKEVQGNPKAKAALDKEWLKLVNAEVWLPKPREWNDVANEAKRMNKTIHVGRVFEICVEKGSELPESDPGRKFKGRSVFRGTMFETRTGIGRSSRNSPLLLRP